MEQQRVFVRNVVTGRLEQVDVSPQEVELLNKLQSKDLEQLQTITADVRYGPEAWCQIGMLFLERKQLPAAKSAFAAAFTLQHDHTRAKHNYIAVLLEEGKGAEAETMLRELIAQDPTDADAKHNLGVALRQQGKIDASVEQLRQAQTQQRAGNRMSIPAWVWAVLFALGLLYAVSKL